jgi:hypothetical protein
MKKALHRFKLDIDLKLSMDIIEVYEEGSFFTSAYNGCPIIKINEVDKTSVSATTQTVYFFTLNQSIGTGSIRRKMLKCLKKNLQDKGKSLKEEIRKTTTLCKKIHKELVNVC